MALTLPTEQIETRQLTLAAAAVLPKKKKEKNFPTKSDTPTFFSPAGDLSSSDDDAAAFYSFDTK